MFGFEEQPATKQTSEPGTKSANPPPAAHSLPELMKQATPGAPPSGAKPGGSGAGAGTPPEKLDMQALSEAASQLFRAMDGLGTDEKTIHAILAGKTKAEVEAIKRIYADHFQTRDSQGNYQPRNLEDDLRNELSGKDLNEVEAALSGDQIKRAAVALQNALDSWFPNKEIVHATLGQINQLTEKDPKTGKAQNPQARVQLAAEFQRLTGKSLEAVLKAKLSGILSDTEFKIAQREMTGDLAGANAVKLDDAMHGGFLGIGTDEDRIQEVLGSVKSKEERRKLLAAYKKETQEEDEEGNKIAGTGKDLTADLASELSGAEEDIANTMLSDDRFDKDPAKRRAAEARIAAGRLRSAAEGLGTDEAAIFKEFQDIKDPLLRDEIKRQYNAQYGDEEHGGVDFDQMLNAELSGNDLERAKQLVNQGDLDPAFALKYAMDGAGTDEELIISTLKKCKSWDEIQNVRKAYMRLKKSEDLFILDKDLEDELSGREGEEVLHQLLQGSNTQDLSPRRKIELAKRAYNFERGSGAGVFGNFVTDLFADSGQVLDLQNQRILAIEKEYEQKGKNPELLQRLDATLNYQKQDIENYQAIQDAITNTGALVGTAVVGTILTVATWGVAGPAMASVLGALAGGAAGIAVKAGMKGDSYSTEDLAMDLAMTLVSAATAGAAAGPFAHIAMRVASLAKSAPMLEFMVMEALKGGQMGIASGVAAGLLDENTWRGTGNGVENFLHHVGVSTLGATASALGTAGMGKLMGQGSRTWNATAGAAGAVVGTTAQAAVDSGGDLDAFVESVKTNLATNVLSSVALANMHEQPAKQAPAGHEPHGTQPHEATRIPGSPEQESALHPSKRVLGSHEAAAAVEAAPVHGNLAGHGPPPEAPPLHAKEPQYGGKRVRGADGKEYLVAPSGKHFEFGPELDAHGRPLSQLDKDGTIGLFERGYYPDRIFRDFVRPDMPSEGWKLHISADSSSAAQVAEIALPLLKKSGISHKVVESAAALAEHMTGGQTGKFITIYPRNAAEARDIVALLDSALAGHSGPAIAGEKPLGTSGLIFGRYGGFNKSTVTDPATGREVQDVRGQMHPPWIKDPFTDLGHPPTAEPVPSTSGSHHAASAEAQTSGAHPEAVESPGGQTTAAPTQSGSQVSPGERAPTLAPQPGQANKHQAVELDLGAIAAAVAEYDAAAQSPHPATAKAASGPEPETAAAPKPTQTATPVAKEMPTTAAGESATSSSQGKGTGHAAASPKRRGKLLELAVGKNDCYEKVRVTPNEWIVEYYAKTPDGTEVFWGSCSVLLDEAGKPAGSPNFFLEARTKIAGQDHALGIYDQVASSGAEEGGARSGVGKRTPATSYALEKMLAQYRQQFGHPPSRLDGSLALDNKLNFQREYYKAIKEQGLPPEEAKLQAIRKIAFGKHRSALGYDSFEVTTKGTVKVDLGPPHGIQEVPEHIDVVAERFS